MTSINTLYNGAYYQLPGQSTAQDATKKGNSPSLAQALMDATNPADSSYSLNLSDEAKKILESSSNTATTSNDKNLNYSLTTAQSKTLDDIIEKYKDEPFTQETFNKIQDDLKAAHLGSETLSLLDRMKNFNPIAVLVAALGGASYDPSQQSDSEAEQNTKADNFMKAVFDKWAKISTTKEVADASNNTADETASA